MGMMLRITYNEVDYNFKVTNTERITKATTAITILFEEKTIELVRDSKGWVCSSQSPEISPEFAQAIGRAIELRMRL